jgi:hypothetical protein
MGELGALERRVDGISLGVPREVVMALKPQFDSQGFTLLKLEQDVRDLSFKVGQLCRNANARC